MLKGLVLAKIRVHTFSEANSLVVHVKNTVVIFEEVDAKIGLASVARRCNLQDAVTISVNHVLMFTDDVVCLLDRKCKIRHRIILLNGTMSTPETHWV